MSNYIHNIGDVIETPNLKNNEYLKQIDSSKDLSIYEYGMYKLISSNLYEDTVVGKFLFEDNTKAKKSNEGDNGTDQQSSSSSSSSSSTSTSTESETTNHYKLKFETLVIHDNQIVGFFPPNPLSFENLYDEKHTAPNDDGHHEIYEWNEGYKICLFNNGSNWEISTNKEVKCTTKINNKTLRSYFYECLHAANLELDQLNESYCYIFQIQHPDLDHVCKIYLPTVYLLNVFNIFHEDGLIFEYNINTDKRVHALFQDTLVCVPSKKDYVNIVDAITSCTKLTKQLPTHQGYIIKTNVKDKFMQQFFIESSDFVYHYYIRKHMKNSNIPTELELQFYSLRQYKLIDQFTTMYPEMKDSFDILHNKINTFCCELYYNYVECYIYKEKELIEYPYYISIHIKRLHDLYIRFHLKKKQSITLSYVNMYVDTLQPIRLKYCIDNIK
mgnify:CR=1 FL=1